MSKSEEAYKYSKKKSNEEHRKESPTSGRKIPRAYSRIAAVPPHRVAVVYPSPGGDATGSTTKKQRKKETKQNYHEK